MGNTGVRGTGGSSRSVHPHVRGEHAEDDVELAEGARFIPTCVGNTRSQHNETLQEAVHPHVRGEHCSSAITCGPVIGSSPRAWGTRQVRHLALQIRRFIPTCVGNTLMTRRAVPLLTVHPHVRGEHINSPGGYVDDGGSSPRAWGTPGIEHAPEPLIRFIPTCVGNTIYHHHGHRGRSVHPHVRGEHSPSQHRHTQNHGSSPRAWGTLQMFVFVDSEERFIPTCVGNTSRAGAVGM